MLHHRFWRSFFGAAALLFSARGAGAQEPQWIWNSTNESAGKEVLFFRKTFVLRDKLIKATLAADADDRGQFFINGKRVANVRDWRAPVEIDVTKEIVPGENVIAVRGENSTSRAGILARLQLTTPTHGAGVYDPKQHAGLRWIDTIVTGPDWVWSAKEMPDWTNVDFEEVDWKPSVSEGKLGAEPWGNIFETRQATPASSLQVEPGFKVELLHSADATEGSWISMTQDNKGRLIISPQSEGQLLRLTLSRGKVSKIERIDSPVTSAMGLLYVKKNLYLNGHGPRGTGIYRLRAKGDGFEPPVLIRQMVGEGEHASHGMALGPDKKLYVVSGNFTKIPPDILPSSPLKNYADDQLLPRAADGKGFGNGLLPPGGFVLRMDLSGSNAELFCAGTRNTYDIDFSPDGELFGFDSDMEWDWGTRWYRPIRINHLVAGGDYGFREGTGKFPEYYEDTLPANLDVGIGSPTGVKFATHSNFPERYRSALFLLDWSYGRIFAARPIPRGATYDFTLETVLRGIPLNLTALAFGKDGALYFITGGRGTESGLYRLSYVGAPRPVTVTNRPPVDPNADQARSVRHDLEFFDGKRDANTIDAIWPWLSSNDRWIRYAARTALEFRNVYQWSARALAEPDPFAGLTALLALARCGPPETQHDLLLALDKFPLDSLIPEQQMLELRVIELSFCRQGFPPPDLARLMIDKLDPHFPATNVDMNVELCQILLYLQDPDAIPKTLALLAKASTQEEQTAYVLHLRTITNGWTLGQRKEYFGWFAKNRDGIGHPPELLQYFKDAGRDYSDGSSFQPFLTNIEMDAASTLTAAESNALAGLLPSPNNAATVAATHKFLKDWKMEDIVPDLEKLKSGRAYSTGKKAFADAQCILCHRFGKSGGSVGPELAAVASRLNSHDILESIILPSKVISDLYQNTIISLRDGDDVVGRIVSETDDKIIVVTDPIKSTKVEVPKSNVLSRRPSKVSPMPDGLVNFMTKDEILDLIAYIQSGGKKSNAAFKK